MNANEKKLYYKLIKLVSKVLENNNIKWIPTSGNLLSIYRYNKLFMPWDDDFDMVVEDKYSDIVINILKKNLPKYIGFTKRKYNNGLLYKIFFKKSYSKYVFPTNFLPEEKKQNLTWPFIDLFINNKSNYNWDISNNLNYNENQLKNKIVNGIKVYIPTIGIRSYNNFKKIIKIVLITVIHKYQLSINK